MVDVSNKTLVFLLVVAIAISVAGTWLSTTRVIVPIQKLTGLPTVGNATVNIQQVVTINVSNGTIDFGTGSVNSSADFALLDSETNNSEWNDTIIDQALRIENLGNVLLNVSVQADRNGTQFICDGETPGTDCGGQATGPPDCDLTNTSSENYLCWWANSQDTSLSFGEVGSCKNVTRSSSNNRAEGFRNETKPVMVNSTNDLVCAYLNFSSAQDEFVFEVKITVPNDASGQKNVTFTFTGSASGPLV